MAKTVSWKWGDKTYEGTVTRETKNLFMLKHITIKLKRFVRKSNGVTRSIC